MNKKTLLLILLAAVLIPVFASAELPKEASAMMEKVKTLALAIGTTLVVIGWVIAGILYLTSMGSTEKSGTAKKAMFAAAVGTVLVILASVAAEIITSALSTGK